MRASNNGMVFTVDINPVPKLAENHYVIIKDARHITKEDLLGNVIDFIFFDCHDYDVQMEAYHQLRREGLLTDDTIIALHDTNTHPGQFTPSSYETSDGWVHQAAERRMLNAFREMGYDSFLLHTKHSVHDHNFPFRHGLAVCTKVKPLVV